MALLPVPAASFGILPSLVLHSLLLIRLGLLKTLACGGFYGLFIEMLYQFYADLFGNEFFRAMEGESLIFREVDLISRRFVVCLP